MSLHRSMAVTESSFCHLGRPDWRTLRRAVLQALFVVLLYLPLAKVQALPPDPAREARLEGWIDAGLARGGSAAGDVSALAVCPTHTWVTPTGGSVTVRMVQASTTSTFAASVSKLTFSDSSTALAFCTDIHHGLGSSVVVCLDETFFSDWRVAWVVTNYPPTTSSRTDQAARQAAVWHLTDAYDLDQTDPTTEGTSTDNAVRTAYNDILNAIPATQPSEYQEGNVDLSIDPATDTNFLPGGEVHPFAVRLTKGGSPLAGVTVNVSTSLGTLNKSSDVTNASGEAYFTVTRSTAGTATLTASASVTLPAGSRFISQSDPLGSQRLVLGQNKTTSTTATGSKIWSSSNNVVIAHKFEDRNFNGVQDEGEPNLSGWSFTLTRPDGNSYSQTTNSSGDATFNNRISGNGTYALTESLQSGWDSSTPLARTRVRSTTDAWMQWHENFGNGQYSIITVVKYRDDDEDAAWDSGSEPTLSGWQFALYDWQGGQWNQLSGATTGDDGTASFTDLTSGSFKIVEHPENCWRSTTATEQQITLGYNQHLTVYFGNVPDNPTPDATAQPSSGCSPLAVQLSGSVTGGTAPYTYTWSFGDGNPNSNTQNPSHTYANPGSYTATLTVTDTKGCTGSDSVIVTVYGHPSASASASPTSGCMPRSVNFSGGASGGAAPYTYSWNFGDSSSSPTQNPSHNYTSAGSYTATLTVTDSHGCTATSNVAITVWPLPIATAQAQPSSGCSPLSVSFTGSASGGTPGYTYSWNFGDGSAPIAAQNPVHTYSTPGDYSAVLTVTDSHGCQDTDTVLVHAYGKPTAQPSASPTSGCVPLAVHFTGAATGGTSPYGFLWDFGDGSPTSTLQNPDHTYTSAGIFIASLQVTDAHGCTDSKTVQITVWSKPTATASGVPTAGCAPLLVSFSGGASGGTPGYTYSWNFGDGGTSTAQSPSHTYTGAGSYTAVLTVTDSHGCQGSQSVVITVYPLPTATATAAPSAGCAPLAVSFTGGASGGTSPYTYSWVFGDGGTSTAQSPSHTYTSAGSYTAVLTVTDSHGCQGSKSVVITVYPLPTASASASPTSGCMPLNVSFTGGASGGTGPYTYSWVFGDSGTSTAQSPSHTYTGAGSYTAVLTVTDSHSCQGSKSVVITVYPLPTATATAAPSAGCAPLSVSFTGGASGGTSPYTYSWVFGDGGTSTAQSPSHTYASAGSYTAVLTVTDSHGCQGSKSVVITVYPLPTATATAAPSAGCTPLTVSFTGGASGGTGPYTYSWVFGDGGTSTAQSPSYTYTGAGSYTAVLTVTDSHGCQGSKSVVITVYPLPTATATAAPSAGCAPLSVSFTGGASGGTSPYTYSWVFGDGGTSTAQSPSHTYTSAGSYTAVLTVTDSHGCQGSKSVVITVYPLPNCTISAPSGVCASSTGNTASVSDAGTGATYQWSITGGTITAGQGTRSLTWSAGTGSQVALDVTVTDGHGCFCTGHATVTIWPLPNCTITAPSGVCASSTGNTASVPDAGTGATYQWSITGGTITAGQGTRSLTWSAGTGSQVALDVTVTDGHGCVCTGHATVTIWPLPNCTISAPSGVCASSTGNSASVPDAGTGATYQWSITGGTITAGQGTRSLTWSAGTGSQVALDVTVTDGHGCVCIGHATVTIWPLPIASASANPTSGCMPLAVSFTGGASGGTPGYAYSWTFGDGGTSTQQSPSHTYTSAGTYTARLTVTDNHGCQDSKTVTITVWPLPTASASANPTSGCMPLAVSFTGGATGGTGPYTYSWVFGDGGTSSAQSPSHTYTGAGSYTAVLTVTDSHGCQGSQSVAITVYPLPTATATAAPSAGCAPLTVSFTGGASGGTSPYTYSWVFGDGSTSTAQSPSHTYTGAGSYTAVLTVTDSHGCQGSQSVVITVYPLPTASASASPTSGCMPLNVSFSGGATGGTPGYTFSWNFDDGSSSPSQSPSHTYTAAGTYHAMLTVTDSHGCQDSKTVTITVWPLPTASASANPTSGCMPLAVSFTGGATGGTPGYTFSWNFDDGSSSPSQSPSHTYTAAGTYHAMLTVTDSHGCQDSKTVTITVWPLPTASASANPTSGCMPLAVSFTGGATGGTPGYTFSWNFDDGSSSPSQSPSHTYTAAGTYHAMLTVTDSHGCQDSKTVTITVWPLPTASASANPTSGCMPLAVSFTGGASGGTPSYTFSWNLDDGGAASSSQNPSHTFTAAGTYHVVLTVTDSHGCQDTEQVNVTVWPLPTASASANPTSGCMPLAVSFTGGATGGTPGYTYSWSFDDGSAASTSQNPSHTFTAAGTYHIVLTVTDSHGCQDTEQVTVTVWPLPTASASASPTSGCMPLNVSFTGGASGGTGPYTYSWVFGDGGTSTAQSPSHTYTGAGSYTAVLTVTDSHSCQGSKSVVITVYPLPTATATAAPSAGCAPLSVSFTGGASGGTSPYTYSWVFGDGGTSPNQNPSHTYSAAGNYTAFLTVTDSHGCQDTEQVVITVYPLPIATASAAPHTGCSPLAVAFAGSATGGTQPYSYSWNFGDSSPINNTQNPGHTYTTPGTYTAVLTVTDSHGCQDTDQVTITVYPLPVARIAAPETAGCAPFQADLHGEASSGTPPYSFHWAFGDGGSADGQDVQHTYTGAGHYTAILTVTDSHGCQDTESIQLEVWEVPTPHASAEPAAGCAPLQVHFTGSATGGTEPYSYFWLLGDGSAMSHEQNPTYTFAHAGTYTARLSVTDDHGCTSSTTVVITVYPLPTATASSEQTQGCAPLTCNFSGGAAGGTPGYSYHWTFGDGATSDEQSPQHTYTLAGSYTAILTVTDSHGCQDTDRVAMTVWPLPVPTIGAEPEQGCAPIQVHFSGSATSGTAPYSFHWEFGDGGTSDEQNPDHVYLNKGVYSARLTVTDAHGCVSTVERTFDASCFNLSISKKDRLDPVCIKDYIRYDITLHNSGLLPLNGVSVVDSLPDHTYYVDSDMGGVGTYGNPVVTWLVDVPAGATIQLYLELGTSSTAPPGVITNTVSASIYEFSTTFTENTTLKGCPVITDTPTQTPTPTRTQTRTPTPTQTGTPTPQGVTPTVPIPGFPLCPVCAQNVIFQSNRDQQWEIYKSNPEGTAQVRLTFNPAQDMAPQWVPAGDAVWAVFQSDRDHNWEIYRMDADGSGQRNLTQNAADDTAPAATCRWIYFQSNRDGNWEIYRMEFNGTLQTRLTDNPATDAQPASSCYERVVFQSNRDGNWELYSMNYDGSDLVRLTNTPWDEVSPSWSPDGNSIAFQSNQSGNWGLYVMDYSGAHVRTLIDTPYAEQSPMWWTCCDWIYFQSDKPALPRAADDTPIWHVWRTNVTGTLSAAVTADHSQNLIDSQVAMELPAEPTLTSTPTPTHTVSPTPVPTFTPTPTLTVTPTPVETPSRPAYRIYLPILFR